ncbi:AzlD domain-containing protein [Acinetobacter sp. SAAs474]|uniref:AzlD domain-containing protein n=2 Tax=unclassified Acinetobacter TaxID=196816 RepID=UPI0029343E60|nr:AzlD domain-containing protein [Acinetobacter sp. SAAs474]
MSWMMILGLAVIVLMNRYLFLDRHFYFKLPTFIENMLKYAAPSLMISMSIPIIFYQQQDFRGVVDNLYVYAAIVTVLLVLYTRKMLLSILGSLIFFYSIIYFMT